MGPTGTATRRTSSLALLAAMCVVAACQPIGARAPDPTAPNLTAARPVPGEGGPFGGAAYAAAMAGPEPAPVNGIGYVVINAPIAPPSRDFFIASVDKLRAAGAHEIDLGINSPGGSIDSAQDIVDYMARVHRDGVTFKTYNLGLVASAATYIFLNAQDRYAGPRGTFLFHAAGMMASGPALINSERLRESADKLDAYERTMRATLAARTHLTPSEAQTYVRRTVLLNADDARRDGVVDAIDEMQLPKGAHAYIISVRPAAPPAIPSPSPPDLPR